MGNNGSQENNASELKEFFSFRKIPDALADYQDSKYVIFGVPFDGTSSFRRGSRVAPDAIRFAYRNLESFDVSYRVDFLEIPITDLGDLGESEDVAEVLDQIEHVTKRIFEDGKIPIMLGGEHSATVGAARNLNDALMVIIDAHSDFRDSYMGNKYNHACVTKRALDLLGPDRIISIGTRSTSKEEYESPQKDQVRFVSANEVRSAGIQKVIEEIESRGAEKIYFSIDMDGIDPAFAPGVGTPEPYGLSDVEVRSILNALSKKIIGLDIVEITPMYDNGNTAMLGAKLIQDFIGSKESKKED